MEGWCRYSLDLKALTLLLSFKKISQHITAGSCQGAALKLTLSSCLTLAPGDKKKKMPLELNKFLS